MLCISRSIRNLSLSIDNEPTDRFFLFEYITIVFVLIDVYFRFQHFLFSVQIWTLYDRRPSSRYVKLVFVHNIETNLYLQIDFILFGSFAAFCCIARARFVTLNRGKSSAAKGRQGPDWL